MDEIVNSHRADADVDADDPHNLQERFVVNQQKQFSQALSEIRQGRKQNHWMWFILPTAPYIKDGVELGSDMNKYFALRGDDAVIAFLKNEYLRENYITINKAIQSELQAGNNLIYLFGSLDHNKVVSSWKLF